MIFKEVRGTVTARNDADRLDWGVTTEDAMLRELQFESLRTFESERAVGVFDYLFRRIDSNSAPELLHTKCLWPRILWLEIPEQNYDCTRCTVTGRQ